MISYSRALSAAALSASLSLTASLTARAQTTPASPPTAAPPAPAAQPSGAASTTTTKPSASRTAPPSKTGVTTVGAPPPATPTPNPAKRLDGPSNLPTAAPSEFIEESRTYGRRPYTRPLLFAPKDNGFNIDNPQLKWEFETPERVNTNGLKLDSKSIVFLFDQVKRAKKVQIFGVDPNEPPYSFNVSFQWPEALSAEGEVTIETMEGKAQWTSPARADERIRWERDLDEAGDELNKKHGNAQWGYFDVPKVELDFLFRGGRYRACLTQKNSAIERLRICSKPFNVLASGQAIRIQGDEKSGAHDVLLDGKTIGESGIIIFPPGKALTLKYIFKDQSFVEVSSQPADLGVVDAVKSEDGKDIILTGHGAKPLGRAREVSTPDNHFWAPTGIPMENVWKVAVPADVPILTVPGAFNVPFTMLLRYEELPRESDRAFIKESRSAGTYSPRPTLEGYIPSGGRISSREWMARKSNTRFFEWSFAAPNKGDDNVARIRIQTKDQKRVWVAHQEIYRGYPFEGSGRLTGVASTEGNMIILGEVSMQGWLESLPYADIEKWQHQKFGASVRAFRALNAVEYAPGKKLETFAVITADLKYHFMPGIWGRDELIGIGLSGQKIDLAHLTANVVGMGAYWGRTMPKVFDDIFNFVPQFRHPKYVDVELYYYPVSLTGGIASGATFNLNFHGRVFWTERLFGEAGFGIKNFELLETGRSKPASLGAAYGTFGLGAVF